MVYMELGFDTDKGRCIPYRDQTVSVIANAFGLSQYEGPGIVIVEMADKSHWIPIRVLPCLSHASLQETIPLIATVALNEIEPSIFGNPDVQSKIGDIRNKQGQDAGDMQGKFRTATWFTWN